MPESQTVCFYLLINLYTETWQNEGHLDARRSEIQGFKHFDGALIVSPEEWTSFGKINKVEGSQNKNLRKFHKNTHILSEHGGPSGKLFRFVSCVHAVPMSGGIRVKF